MNNSRRYCKIKRNNKYHVGVLDREESIVCHVTNNKGKAEYRFDDPYLFDPEQKGYQQIENNIEQCDETIKEQWDFIKEIKENPDAKLWKVNGKEISAHLYDVSGLGGVSCESITEFILNGKLKVDRGTILGIARRMGLIDREGNVLGFIDGGSSNS